MRVRWRALLLESLGILMPAVLLWVALTYGPGWRASPPTLTPARLAPMPSISDQEAFCRHAWLEVADIRAGMSCAQVEAVLLRSEGGTSASPPPAVLRLREACISGRAVVVDRALVFPSSALQSICYGHSVPAACRRVCEAYNVP